MQAVAYQPTYEVDYSVIAIVIRIPVEIVFSPFLPQIARQTTRLNTWYSVSTLNLGSQVVTASS